MEDQLKLWEDEETEYSKMYTLVMELKESQDKTRKRLFREIGELKEQLKQAGITPLTDLPLFAEDGTHK